LADSAGRPARVCATAWCRADLAGGTLDIWPLGLLHQGARTLNVALDLAVEVTLLRRTSGYHLVQEGWSVEAESTLELAGSPEGALVGMIAAELELPPSEIRIRSGSPRGGGLGASSALAVGLITAGEALKGEAVSTPRARAALARDLEARLMSLPTGRQDHFPAMLGGLLEIRHEAGGEQVVRLDVDLECLGRSLLVAFTGESHFSAGNNWRIIRRRLEGDVETIRCFEGIRDAAEEMSEALQRGDLLRVGELMSREWGWRRRLAEGISTPTTERQLAAARAAGAWGGKGCGAGGGGCIVLMCPPDRRPGVASALETSGAMVLRASPEGRPLQLATNGALWRSRGSDHES
jgi:D-glycero-alpha-D-manno-heptose-7-phosphate kinase